MQEFEHFTDHIIPWLVVGLAVVLILENPFWTLVHLEEYEPWVTIFDSAVVFFFVIDLAFKWERTKNIRSFLKLYWLDIVAVFPFYLAIRTYTEFAGILRIGEEATETAQKLAHEAVLLREAGAVKEAEVLAKESRLARQAGIIGRSTRAGARLLRAMKGRFYVSYHALMSIHEKHKRTHKITSQQSRQVRPGVPKRS